VQALVDAVRSVSPVVANDVGSDALGLSDIQRVLRGLLGESVPVRDLVRILEAVTARSRETRDPEALLEAARHALGAAISAHVASDGVMQALTFEPILEQSLLESLRTGESGSFLALDPVRTERLLEGIADAITAAEQHGHRPVVLCSAQLRPAVRRLVAPGHAHVPVLSYNELTRTISVEPVGVIRLVTSPAAV